MEECRKLIVLVKCRKN
ncbi:hypothetical protein Pint_11024 [Pistacia integerrima]|uniref:Uncharacterized protein n=1 Tax=Pistacia integerrima TaxID=434235 RepID=A0ACC0XHA5_9ROSI|nr:hypothetical protein Pint_11024 [Pistacia integerrima]